MKTIPSLRPYVFLFLASFILGEVSFSQQYNRSSGITFYSPVLVAEPGEPIDSDHLIGLKWQINNNSSVTHFIVERSFDGLSFEDAGVMISEENVHGSCIYEMNNEVVDLDEGFVFYRIRVFYKIGYDQASEIKSIKIEENEIRGEFAAYPNPAGDVIQLRLPDELRNKDIVLKVYNGAGNVVLATIWTAARKDALTVARLSPGLYIIRAFTEGENHQCLLVKQ